MTCRAIEWAPAWKVSAQLDRDNAGYESSPGDSEANNGAGSQSHAPGRMSQSAARTRRARERFIRNQALTIRKLDGRQVRGSLPSS
jgi:hypothetical protein